MRGIKELVMLPVIALGLVSCVTYMQTHFYTIDTAPAVTAAATQLPLTVSINNVRSPSRYQDQMFYRASDYRVGFYEYSHWVEPPSEMVRRALTNALKSSNLFKRVEPIGIIGSANLILQTDIESFDQVISKEGTFAECTFVFELVKASSGQSVWTYEAKARVKQQGKGKFVGAMSEAVAMALNDALGDMAHSDQIKACAEGGKKQ
ncbi:MAG: ABC-type transport auxiliary lipoprotein family protein [Candidatus Aureabacteria bacterium]|nr:ABC-type transport auxiliary lipoprotein family protein [Candidatus Auribacterota bacterium]